jgi:hypothetical protein
MISGTLAAEQCLHAQHAIKNHLAHRTISVNVAVGQTSF